LAGRVDCNANIIDGCEKTVEECLDLDGGV
jgi:hypothetical protein